VILNKTRHLIPIDDAVIRATHFLAASKIMRKIERLESAISAFHASDQKLFSEWFELTFRADREAVEEKMTDYKKLAAFHNSIVAAAKMLQISMPEAYLLIRQEEDLYRNADEATRQKIEQTRQDRDRFARDEMEREFCEQDGDNDFEDEDSDDDSVAMNGMESEEEPKLTPADRAEIQRLQTLTEKKLRQSLRGFEQGREILLTALRFAVLGGDPALFIRAWDLAPHRLREDLQRLCHANGLPLKAQIEDMREWLKWNSQTGEDLGSESEDEIPNEGDGRHGGYIGYGPGRAGRRSPLQEEKLKVLYRKLARKLHPDAHPGDRQKDRVWKNKLWLRVQESYRAGDTLTLEKLNHLVLLRDRDLNSLTVDEIRQSQNWLTEDLRALEREAKQLRRVPAWKFSKRKNLDPLIRNIRRDFREQMTKIESEIVELTAFHAILEGLASRPQKRAARKKGTTRKRRKSAKRQRRDDPQMNLF
jgi:hypothetical protein